MVEEVLLTYKILVTGEELVQTKWHTVTDLVKFVTLQMFVTTLIVCEGKCLF